LKRIPAIALLVTLMALAWSPAASVQVQTRVRIIEASNRGFVVDPSLRDVHDQLGSLFNFTSYRLLRDLNLRLAGTRPVEIPVHRGRSMEITLVGAYRNLIELRIRIKRDGAPILNTQVRLNAGRTILIGGPKHGEGTMIFAISAHP